MAQSSWWDVCNQGTKCLPWNPGTPGEQPDWGVKGERSDYGVPLPQGTPVQSPVNGIVLPQHPGGGWYSVFGKQSFGGEVDILSSVPEYGGLVNVGVIHMDTASVVPGQVVRKGHIIGTSGGQTSGGNWPSSPQFSSGPHVGLQVHNIYQWGDLKDPGILMGNLWAGKDSSNVPTANQLSSAKLMQVTQGGPKNGCDWITWGKCFLQADATACAACAAGATAAVAGNPPGSNPALGSLNCAPWDVACLLKQGGPFILRAVKFVAGFGILLLATLITFLPEVGAGVAIASGVPEAAPAVSQALGGRRRLPQTQIGAGVQAVSIFKAHGQKKTKESRANVAAVQRGQPAPFPASPGAPGQPAPRTRGARAGAAVPGGGVSGGGNRAGSPVGGGVPGSGAGRGRRGKQPAQKMTPNAAPTPATPVPATGGGGKAAPQPSVQRGGKVGPLGTPPPPGPRITQPLPIVVPGPKTGLSPLSSFVPPGAGKMRPSAGGAAPSEPPHEPYRGHGWGGVVPPVPRTPKEPPVEPPMPAPTVPTPPRKQPVNARERLGVPGRGRRGRPAGPVPVSPTPQRAAPTHPLKRPYEKPALSEGLPSPFTFEEALAQLRARRLTPAQQAAKARQKVIEQHKKEERGFDDILDDLRKGLGGEK